MIFLFARIIALSLIANKSLAAWSEIIQHLLLSSVCKFTIDNDECFTLSFTSERLFDSELNPVSNLFKDFNKSGKLDKFKQCLEKNHSDLLLHSALGIPRKDYASV